MGRNKEFKSIIMKIFILVLIFFIAITWAGDRFLDSINRKIIQRDFAIVGKLIEKYPEDKNIIISNISKEGKEEDVNRGQALLKEYGYQEDIKTTSQPLLSRGKSEMMKYISILIIGFLILLIGLIYLEYKKIYKKVNKVSKASEKVMEGDFTLLLDESREGDFHILNHHFNQMSGRLKNNLDTLKGEKIYLKDTISNISHQLKTPLSALIVLNDILLNEKDMEEKLRIDFLEKTSSQLSRMEWLILNLLKLARIEAGSIDFKREEVSLKEVIDLSLQTLEPLVKESEIFIDGDMDCEFIGDRDWTVEAFINIIKNSIEHGRGKVHIVLEESPLFTSVSIRDNGKGIDPKDLPHIFDRFFKGTTTVKANSIGIGLNLSKSIVEAQDGLISLESKVSKGSVFTIRFLKKKLDKD